jgi:hypothetical protein
VLAGCDMLGLETAPQIAERKNTEGRAIGSACRHAVRSIEDCYSNNPKAPKAAVFEGWRTMDEYMRENNIEGMPYSRKPAPVITETRTGETVTGSAPPAAAGATPPINLPPRPSVVPRPN